MAGLTANTPPSTSAPFFDLERLEVCRCRRGRPSHNRQRKVVLARVLACFAGLEEVGAGLRHVVGRDDQIGSRLRQALVGEKALQRGVERVGVVFLVEQAFRAAYALEEAAVEDLGPLVRVEADQLLRRQRIGRAQRAREDAAGGGAGDQVEELEGPTPRAALELGQNEGGDEAAYAPSVNRQYSHLPKVSLQMNSCVAPLSSSWSLS
jgi:hypothetical protein